MKKKIVAGFLAAVLAAVPAGSVLAESADVVLVEEGEVLLQAEDDSMAEIVLESPGSEADQEEVAEGQAEAAEAETSAEQMEAVAPGGTEDGEETAADGSHEPAEMIPADQPESGNSSETQGETGNPDGIFAADELNLEEDGLLLSVEEAEAPEGLAGAETVTFAEEVAGQLAEAGSSADASLPMFRMFADTVYVDSYGGQLEGLAQQLYAQMKAKYVTKRGAGNLSYTFTKPYTFRVDDGHIEKDNNGDNVLIWDSEANEMYQEIVSEICYGMQAAYDAFIYDYPEVFWLAAPSYSWGLSFTGSDSTFYTGTITSVELKPQEYYTGASSEIAAFDSAVSRTVAEISKGLPAGASRTDTVEAIHDYLCRTLSYGENAYAHTAAGVFLKNKVVVCEGYAKSFKILCNKFGYQCALVSGEALKSDGSTEAHMWNYVRMGDGKWYLVDTTWDDQGSYISSQYFLAGSTSQGFNAPINEERLVYTNFSGENVLTKSFAVPVLSETAYNGETAHTHEWESTKTVDKQPTCTAKGSKSLHCRICGESKPGSEEAVNMTPHKETDVKVVRAATCQKEGEATYTCSVCGSKGKKTLPRVAHKWKSQKTVDRKSTCTVKGQKSTHCSVCNAVKPGSAEAIALAAHKYGAWKITKQPTALATGMRQRTCTVCKKTVQKQTVAKLKATIKVNVSAVTLKKGQSASPVKVSGLAKGDYVKSWTSANTKLVTVDKKGTLKAQKKTGKTTVTITLASGLKKKISVTVQSGTVKTTKITCTPGTVTVKKGAKLTLKPSVAPLTSQEKITYKSSNSKVAAVSSKGVVTAKGAGTAKITIASGKKSCTVKVTVPAVKTQKITASTSVTLKKGKSRTLSVKLTPANSDEKITWCSSNAKVVSVNKNGKITAKKKGTAVITIKSGKVRVTCKVQVN